MYEWMTLTTESLFNWALVILRFAIGPCFIVHGLGKLGLVGSGTMAGFEGWLKSLNVPFPALQARLAMLAEIAGGLCVTLGILYRPALVVLFFTMLVATVVGHKGAGYLITNNPPGNEYALNLAVICVVMFLLGPGSFSLDYLIFAI